MEHLAVPRSQLTCGKTYYWATDSEHQKVMKQIKAHKLVCPKCKELKRWDTERQMRVAHF